MAEINYTARNRREQPRMSDIKRAVDKVVVDDSQWGASIPLESDKEKYPAGGCVTGPYGQAGQNAVPVKLYVDKSPQQRFDGETFPAADKNTPESLKTLRWEIYDLLDRYDADYGRTIKFTLMQEVERLFNLYTHS